MGGQILDYTKCSRFLHNYVIPKIQISNKSAMCLTKKYKYQHLYTPGDVNNKYMNTNICISQKMFITSCILEQGRKIYHSIKNYLLANRSMELCQEYWRFTVNHSQISWR